MGSILYSGTSAIWEARNKVSGVSACQPPADSAVSPSGRYIDRPYELRLPWFTNA